MIQTISTRLADLPTTVAAYTILDENADYTIVINAKMSQERAREAYQHEMGHIIRDDFHSDMAVDEIEVRAHEKI